MSTNYSNAAEKTAAQEAVEKPSAPSATKSSVNSLNLLSQGDQPQPAGGASAYDDVRSSNPALHSLITGGDAFNSGFGLADSSAPSSGYGGSGTDTRPADPHYVAQTHYDVNQGIKDLNSGHFAQGEANVRRGISDLNKENSLIKSGEKGGNHALTALENGNTTHAETALSNTINHLQGNYFNAQDRTDYEAAERDLQDGKTGAAAREIGAAEGRLTNRDQKVVEARTDLHQGLQDFNSGNYNQGIHQMKEGLHDVSRTV